MYLDEPPLFLNEKELFGSDLTLIYPTLQNFIVCFYSKRRVNPLCIWGNFQKLLKYRHKYDKKVRENSLATPKGGSSNRGGVPRRLAINRWTPRWWDLCQTLLLLPVTTMKEPVFRFESVTSPPVIWIIDQSNPKSLLIA